MVRKRVLGVAIAALVAVAIPVASASANGYGAAPGSYVAGIGQNHPDPSLPVNWFAFAAHADQGGANPYGLVGFAGPITGGIAAFAGHVQCLRVSGNQATMVFSLDYQLNQSTRFNGGVDVVFIQDNGRPVHGHSVDQIRNFRVTADNLPVACPDPQNPGVPALTSGDIVVHDGGH